MTPLFIALKGSVDSTQLRQLEIELEEIMDPKVDSLRYYRLIIMTQK